MTARAGVYADSRGTTVGRSKGEVGLARGTRVTQSKEVTPPFEAVTVLLAHTTTRGAVGSLDEDGSKRVWGRCVGMYC